MASYDNHLFSVCHKSRIVKLGNSPFSTGNSGKGFGMGGLAVAAMLYSELEMWVWGRFLKIVLKVASRARQKPFIKQSSSTGIQTFSGPKNNSAMLQCGERGIR